MYLQEYFNQKHVSRTNIHIDIDLINLSSFKGTCTSQKIVYLLRGK